jgi:predicted nucleic acid-binding protein
MNGHTLKVEMKSGQRIYLDMCCVNRPFDDQGQERIHMETEAIEAVILHVEQGEWTWVGSDALMYEAANLTDVERRSRIVDLLNGVRVWVQSGYHERQRAVMLMAMGFKPLDALHVACAESAGVDVLLTTDDRLLRTASRRARDLKVPVANPLSWLEEQIL